MIQKPARVQNRAYRMYVALQPCFACGVAGLSQCCHRNGGGMGTKHSDYESFPLCSTRPGEVGCHMRHDLLMDGMTREQRRDLEDAYVDRMRKIAEADGWLP